MPKFFSMFIKIPTAFNQSPAYLSKVMTILYNVYDRARARKITHATPLQ